MDIKRILKEEIERQSKNRLDYIIKESLHESISRYILNESQESSSQKKAKILAIENGMTDEEAENFVRIELRNKISGLKDKAIAKFTLGCARLYLNGDLETSESLKFINDVIHLIKDKYYNEFDKNLNDLSINEIYDEFKLELNDIEEKNRSEINSREYTNNGYDIVPINSFEQSKSYGIYCFKNSEWCITYMKNMWDNYTDNGLNQVYFCLKNGYEDMKAPEELDGNFKDEYGLSMISVIVDGGGNLLYSTTRYNHANNANGEKDLTVKEISDIVGVNFYNTFKPNNELTKKIEDAAIKLSNGVDLKKIFDEVYKYHDGIMYKVRLSSKENLIDSNMQLISDIWFDKISNRHKDYVIVKLNNRFNLFNFVKNELCCEWYDEITQVSNDRYLVKLNGKYNIVSGDGDVISEEWFDDASDLKKLQ